MERRRHARLSIALPITYWKVHDESVHRSMAFDITKRGSSSKQPQDLIIEDIIHFEIKILEEAVTGTAKVLWSGGVIERSNTERAGCIILTLTERSREVFYSFIDGVMNKLTSGGCHS
ncbi:MAG: hypothetical protein JRE23_10165 [Deltaproteobacteria bacterium]|nr:hypothetical protein [Deltaproteobacteria bacterium]